jgi:hypothetical protein
MPTAFWNQLTMFEQRQLDPFDVQQPASSDKSRSTMILQQKQSAVTLETRCGNNPTLKNPALESRCGNNPTLESTCSDDPMLESTCRNNLTLESRCRFLMVHHSHAFLKNRILELCSSPLLGVAPAAPGLVTSRRSHRRPWGVGSPASGTSSSREQHGHEHLQQEKPQKPNG